MDEDKELSEEEEREKSDEEKTQKNVRAFFGYFFHNPLREYTQRRPWVLERPSPHTEIRLADGLEKLWFIHIEFHTRHVRNFFSFRRREKFSLRFYTSSGYKNVWQSLIQHGRDYEDFWFGKKHFEEFVEIFERDVDEKIQNDINITFELGYDVLDYFNAENKPSKSEEKKIKKVIEEGIKEGNKRFIEDLKSIRVNLKHILQWKENRLKHFASVWLPYLTFAAVIILGAVQVWLALRN